MEHFNQDGPRDCPYNMAGERCQVTCQKPLVNGTPVSVQQISGSPLQPGTCSKYKLQDE
jgi:hypothetical protein